MENGSAERHLNHGSRGILPEYPLTSLRIFFWSASHVQILLVCIHCLAFSGIVPGKAWRAIEGMETVVASVSGYHGRERFKLIKLITQTGAHYVGTMARSTTHLVCWELEGKKYNLARSFGTKVVSHLWFLDCLKKGRRISERPYILKSGKEVGPILWDIPEDDDHGNKNMLHYLSNTCDITQEPDETKNPGPNLFEKESSVRDLVESSNSMDRRIRKLRRKNRTDFSNHARSESKHRVETSYTQEIINCDFIDIQSPQHEEDAHLGNQTAELEDIVDLNNSPDPECMQFETAISSKSSPAKEREDRETSPSSNPLGSPSEMSCVICWTDFSSSRGVLACGHRFCYSCIKGWSDCMASKRKAPMCPLCKAEFSSITKVDSAASSDQKIYSQTIPSSSEGHLCFSLIDQDFFAHSQDGLEEMACHVCRTREPEEQLECCHICRSRWVHSCCLDPPVLPWTCVHCRDLRVLYQLFR